MKVHWYFFQLLQKYQCYLPNMHLSHVRNEQQIQRIRYLLITTSTSFTFKQMELHQCSAGLPFPLPLAISSVKNQEYKPIEMETQIHEINNEMLIRQIPLGKPDESNRSILSTRLCMDFKTKFRDDTRFLTPDIFAACCIMKGDGASARS